MKKLTLILSTPKKTTFIGTIIKLFQGTPFSHAALKLEITTLGREIIYEAGWNGIVCESFERWLVRNKIVFEHTFEYNDDEYRELQRYCIDQLGKPYGWKNILAIALKRNIISDEDDSFICSELAFKVLRSQLGHWFINQDYVTPKDLYNKLRELYEG